MATVNNQTAATDQTGATTKVEYDSALIGNEAGGKVYTGEVPTKYIIGKIPGYNIGILPTKNSGKTVGSDSQDLYYNRLLNNLNTIEFTPTSYHLHFTGDIASMVEGLFTTITSDNGDMKVPTEDAKTLVKHLTDFGGGLYDEISDSTSITKALGAIYDQTAKLSTNLTGDTIRVSRMKNTKQWVELLGLGILHNDNTGLTKTLQFGFTVLGTNDSTFNETISNTFGMNKVQEVAGDIGAKVKESALGMVGTGLAYWKSMNSNAGIQALQAQGKWGLLGALSGLVQGVKIELPQVWQNGDYNSSLNIMIKLVSPSGDSDSIQRYIKDPLEILLRATAPVTIDGLTYGYPMIWDVRAHGIMHLKLAAITAMTITSGGNDTVYNKYDEPLNVDVRLMITPINPGFAQGSMRDYSMTDPTDVIYSMSSTYKQRDVEWVGGQMKDSTTNMDRKKIMI